ncbi:hypothetical protein [Streptomyces sp. 3213.3]|uniref:hypothetical protein n=1 Tax=Streptomyces sp. 3213.3 TaxID=1855348 RepID=UPI00135C77C2|nr:hypothetical protein [Streptomyces sp. 3213.3]
MRSSSALEDCPHLRRLTIHNCARVEDIPAGPVSELRVSHDVGHDIDYATD